MLRRLQAFFVLGVCFVSVPAAAQDLAEEPTYYNNYNDQQSDQAGTGSTAAQESAEEPAYNQQSDQAGTGTPAGQEAKSAAGTTRPMEPPPAAPPSTTEGVLEGWHTEVTGYFRAPLALGFSSRPGPDNINGPVKTQVAYGPNRTVDASYYSFSYTRLQEQDWAEVIIHEKKKHVDAGVGWMGYWYGATGYRNLDAAWVPGIGYLKLDSDVELSPSFKPNAAITMGAFWPKFGYFAKYDTFTLGQFRQVGEQVKLTLPLNPDFALAIVQGFGTGRDGSFNVTVNPLYGGKTGIDLLHYENIQFTYKKYVDIGIHYNDEWTADPNLFDRGTLGSGKSYSDDASKADLSVVGAEVGLSAPYAGRVWLSPSYITVKNGWALGQGTEVMHSLGGAGIATNYMAWNNTPTSSTGSGSMFNLGFLYENTLSGVQGEAPGSVMPEVTLNFFGLLTNASLDLPAGSMVTQKSIKGFKWGADVTVQPLTWLAVMLRYDSVDMNTDKPAYIYSAITPRLIISSHFLSGESIYFQYSRYFYGDKMVLAAQWPWGTPIVAGSDIIQGGRYTGMKPDMDVFKIQATVAF
jgi:hypothetical protein